MSWRFPPWDRDVTEHTSRTEVPEAGGWLYQIRDPNGAHGHVFVPDLTVWADAFAAANVAAGRAASPVAVALDLNRVRHVKQPKPGPRE